MITRRIALFRIAATSAAVATATTASAVAQAQPKATAGKFQSPEEYLNAMLAIGWTPRAMFIRCDDDKIRRMGVSENARSESHCSQTWDQFHAIQMRTPIQSASDLPTSRWWDEVWAFLYDRGYRQDATVSAAGT